MPAHGVGPWASLVAWHGLELYVHGLFGPFYIPTLSSSYSPIHEVILIFKKGKL